MTLVTGTGVRDGSKAHPERGGCVEAMWLASIDSIPRGLPGRGGRETLEGSLGLGRAFPEHSCVRRGWSGDMREELFPSLSPPPAQPWHLALSSLLSPGSQGTLPGICSDLLSVPLSGIHGPAHPRPQGAPVVTERGCLCTRLMLWRQKPLDSALFVLKLQRKENRASSGNSGGSLTVPGCGTR